MTNLHKLGIFGVFLALILLSSCICGAYAQNNTSSTQNNPTQGSTETGPVPAPSIERNPVRSGETGCGITVISGDFNSNWYAVRGDGSPGNNLEGLYSNIQYDIGNSQMCFETQLASSNDGGSGNFGVGQPNATSSYAISIDCDGTIIPINLYNCAFFNESRTNVIYVGDLPEFNNTFTFHNVSLDTYGHGSSTVTISLTQQFIANWTEMTVKMDTDVDFSNMQLYSPITQQPISAGTQFSLTLVYTVDMSNFTASQEVGHAVNFQPTVTPTQIYYTGDNGFGYQYKMANMNFGDSYTEVQGNNQIPNQTPETYFQSQRPGVQGDGAAFVLCFQTFNGLTYGLTTGLNSDPTLTIPHKPVQSMTQILFVLILLAVVAVTAILGVALLVRHRRHRNQP